MTSFDKAGIIITIAIVAVAVSLSATGGLTSESVVEGKKSHFAGELQKEVEVVKKEIEVIQEVAKDVKETSQKAKEEIKELTTSKLPARLVKIPLGAHTPGCEDKCYDPYSLIIFKGAEVIWRNDDTAAHTVTSGNALEGPDQKFDSGLMSPGETFSYGFDSVGKHQYFCMIHPWAKASVTVK